MDQISSQQKNGSRFAKIGMAVCCIIMVAPIAAVLLAGGGISTITNNIGLVAPLALCLGLHFVMHKMMGRSCHGSSATNEGLQPVAIDESAEPDTPQETVTLRRKSGCRPS